MRNQESFQSITASIDTNIIVEIRKVIQFNKYKSKSTLQYNFIRITKYTHRSIDYWIMQMQTKINVNCQIIKTEKENREKYKVRLVIELNPTKNNNAD